MKDQTRRSFLLALGALIAACGQGEIIVTPGKRKKKALPEPTDDDEHVAGEPEETPAPVNAQPGKPEWTTKAKALVGKNEGGKVYTAEAPGPFAGKERSHVPKVNVDAGVGVILVNHVMDAGGAPVEAGPADAGDAGDAGAEAGASPTHFVTTIWVEDDQGLVLALRELKANESAPPAFAFKLPGGTKKVRAFEHCNLHGVWASDEVVLA